MRKPGMTTEQIARKVLRSYLVRCHHIITDDYPEISNMSADGSADYLLHLQDTGRIHITLYKKDGNRLACKITDLDPKVES